MAPGALIGQLPSRKSRYFHNTSDARLCFIRYSLLLGSLYQVKGYQLRVGRYGNVIR